MLKDLDTALYDVVVVSPRNYFLFTPLLPGKHQNWQFGQWSGVQNKIGRMRSKIPDRRHRIECVERMIKNCLPWAVTLEIVVPGVTTGSVEARSISEPIRRIIVRVRAHTLSHL